MPGYCRRRVTCLRFSWGFLENLEDKEKIIHELKFKGNGVCENGCHKYNKSMDDVVKAGFKHKDAAIAMKEIAENFKKEKSET